MRESFNLLSLFSVLFFTTTSSQADLESSVNYGEAIQLLTDGNYGACSKKLDLLLNQNDPQLTATEKNQVATLLLETLIRDKKYKEAISLSARFPELQSSKTARFWHALSLVEIQKVAEAESILKELITGPIFQYQDWASLTLASIALKRSDAEVAIPYLENLRKKEPADQEQEDAKLIHLNATILLRDAYLLNDRKEEAALQWLHLIRDHPNSKLLPSAFKKLAIANALSLPEIIQDLARWEAEDPFYPDRQIYSQYYYAHAQKQTGRPLDAQQQFESFITKHPEHPLYYQANLELAKLLITQKNIKQARSLLRKLKPSLLSPSQHAEAFHLEAIIDFKQGNFVSAENNFLKSSDRANGSRSTEIAAFNVALTALYADDEKTFKQYQDLLSQSDNADLQGELLLEQGLFLASHSITRTFETLSDFLENFPTHNRTIDAHIALAELYLNEIPPKPVSAREHLEAASQHELSRQQKESLDYIAVWIEQSDDNFPATVEQCLLYLDHWPNSPRAPEIRLKLGNAYYREKDYSLAMVALEQVAENHPDSPLVGAALFSAGKAASLSIHPEDRDHAIELWSKLAVNSSDPLALFARHEQGLFKLKLDEFADAITAFDSILTHDPPAPLELKLAVLADRGQAMFNIATARNNEADFLLSAIQSFDSILSDPNASPAWRNQAAVRKAKCLERLGRLDEALNTYIDIVQSDRLTEGTVSDAPVAQAEWFFRAGLGAIRLLEDKKEWHKAIRIADSLANSGSSRAIEAAKLADRIRLKHFIWDQPDK